MEFNPPKSLDFSGKTTHFKSAQDDQQQRKEIFSNLGLVQKVVKTTLEKDKCQRIER